MNPLRLKPELQSYVDDLVTQGLSGVRVPKGAAFDLVTSACEAVEDGTAITTGSHGDSFPMISLQEVVSRLDDDSIEFRLDLPEEVPVDDGLRVAAVRHQLRSLLGEGDPGDDFPSLVCDVIVESSDGQRVSLCFVMSDGYSVLTGPDIEWVGVYPSLDVWRKEVSDAGVITSVAEADILSDHDIICAWRECHGTT